MLRISGCYEFTSGGDKLFRAVILNKEVSIREVQTLWAKRLAKEVASAALFADKGGKVIMNPDIFVDILNG